MADSDEFTGAAESFRRRGHFWRMLSLLQLPISFLLIYYFVTRYLGADTIVDVPTIRTYEETRLTGIPEKEYINTAQNIVNLIGTFQPTTARDQFEDAKTYMLDTAMPAFEETQMNQELNTAEQSSTSQILYVEHTTVKKTGGTTQVCLRGYRQRTVERNVLPQQEVTYCLDFLDKAPTEENPFGLMVSTFSQKLGPAIAAPVPVKVPPKFEQPKDKPKRITRDIPSSFPNARKGG